MLQLAGAHLDGGRERLLREGRICEAGESSAFSQLAYSILAEHRDGSTRGGARDASVPCAVFLGEWSRGDRETDTQNRPPQACGETGLSRASEARFAETVDWAQVV